MNQVNMNPFALPVFDRIIGLVVLTLVVGVPYAYWHGLTQVLPYLSR